MKLKARHIQPTKTFGHESVARFEDAHPHRGGTDLSFNQGLTPTEYQSRIETLHHGYHEVLNESLCDGIARGARLYLSMHSFTPVFGGQQRDVEIGVLFDRYDDLAEHACQTLETLEHFEIG